MSVVIKAYRKAAIGDVREAQWFLSRFGGRQYDNIYDLHGNPWIMPPEAVVGNGMAAIKTYYADVGMAIDAGAEVVSRRVLKVVLVGSASAGKTSLMESIISKRANRTEGTPEEASTEGINVRPHQLENTSVEFYDCAGQVDYEGMHQVFLTRRALFLLVWDITTCSGLSIVDLDRVIHDSIMRWLYTLHLRAPGATVLLVANKIDMTVNNAAETVRMVEERVRTMLKTWKDGRGLGQSSNEYGHASPQKSTEINLLKDSSLISCDTFAGISTLIERVLDQCVSSIKVPPSWELALEFINALRGKRSPLRACLEYLKLPVTGENVGTEWSGTFITKEELSNMWTNVVEKAKGEMLQTNKSGMSRLWQYFVTTVTEGLSKRGNDAAVNNSDSALKGALQISEFAGHILLDGNGKGVFLDVVWLSELVTPILSHKLKYKHFPTAVLGTMRDDLVEDKILRWEFARYLWRDILSRSSLQWGEWVAHALYSVLIRLGVILPLGTTICATNEWGTLQGLQSIHETSSDPPDMLVLMRLGETPNEEQLRSHEGVTATFGDAPEVILKWEFDSAGSPHGLVERIIASCHKIGVTERGLCWRYGAIFRSGQMSHLITTAIRYDTTARLLMVRVIGRLNNLRVWASLRYVASAVVILSKEWPGAILRGSPVCPEHRSESSVIYLEIPDKAHVGGQLIPEAAPGARRNRCDCHKHADKVLGRVVNDLGCVVDINKDPFEGLPDPEVPSSSDDHEVPTARWSSLRRELQNVFNVWRHSARETAMGLWGLALVLFGGITTGVVEENPTLWQVCLGLMFFSLMGAVASSVVFYQDIHRNTNQQDDRRGRRPPSGVAYGDV